MSTDYHTPYVDGTTTYKAADMNAPLGELDEEIGNINDDLDTNYYTQTNMQTSGAAQLHYANLTNVPATFAPSAHDHDDSYYTESELNTSGGGGQVHWDNITDKPTIGTGDGDVVGPATNSDNYVPQWDGANAKTLKDGFVITDAGKAILDDADAAAQRTTLGLGDSSTKNVGTGSGDVAAGNHTQVQPISINISYPKDQKPAASEEIDILIANACTIAADFSGSYYRAITAPTAEVVITVKKNGTSVGTITVAGSGTTATFDSSDTAISLSAGDYLTFVFPAQDSAWAGVSLAIAASRNI